MNMRIKQMMAALLITILLFPSFINTCYAESIYDEEPQHHEFLTVIEEESWDDDSKTEYSMYSFRGKNEAQQYLEQTNNRLLVPIFDGNIQITEVCFSNYMNGGIAEYLDQDHYINSFEFPKNGVVQNFRFDLDKEIIENQPTPVDTKLKKIVLRPQNGKYLMINIPRSSCLKGISIGDNDLNKNHEVTFKDDGDLTTTYSKTPGWNRGEKTKDTIDKLLSDQRYKRYLYNPNVYSNIKFKYSSDNIEKDFSGRVNPVRLKLILKNKKTQETLQAMDIVGQEVFKRTLEKTKGLDGEYYEYQYIKRRATNPRFLTDYNPFNGFDNEEKEKKEEFYQGILNAVSDSDEGETEIEKKFWQRVESLMISVPKENYFALNQEEEALITPPDIPGYKTPEATEIDFTYQGNESLYTRNDTDLVWDRELVFEYEPTEAQTHTVTFKVDGQADQTETVENGKTVSKPAEDPVKDGFTFKGWYKEEEGNTPWNFDTAITEDIILVAKFEEEAAVKTHTVTFEVPGVSPQLVTVKDGQSVPEPEKPTNGKKIFLGWYNGKDEWNFSSPITKDITLTAKFRDYEVIFKADDATFTTTSATPDGKLIKPVQTPIKEGYVFEGWYLNNKKWDFDKDLVTQDGLILEAHFVKKEDEPKTDVKKDILRTLVENYKNTKEGDYSPESWDVFLAEMEKAKRILADPNVSQTQVDKASQDLAQAYQNLQFKNPNTEVKANRVQEVAKLHVKTGLEASEVTSQFPKTIRVDLSNGKAYDLPVTWTIYNYNKNYPGTYDVKGVYRLPKDVDKDQRNQLIFTQVILEGQEQESFKSFEPLTKIVVNRGEDPTLPQTVLVHYKDGTTKRLNVSWDLASFNKDKVGNYQIYGRVQGLMEKPSLTIEVKEETSINRVTNARVYLRDIYGHWAEPAIKWTVENNLFYGNDRQGFGPNKKITRGEFISVLFRLTGQKAENYLNTYFDDVHQGEYFQGAIEWGRRNNVVAGYGDGKFHPDDTLTREQEAAILRRFNNTMNFKFEGVGRKTFADEGRISDWAKEDVRTLQVQGLMTGNQYNQFMPKKQITRAEIAQILYNMNNRVIGTRSTQFNTNATTTTGSSPTTSSGTRYQGILPTNNGTSTTVNPGTTPDRNQSSTTTQGTATVSIDILTGLRNLNAFSSNMRGRIPSNGYFLNPTKISITPGESVWDVTQRAANQYGISIRKEFTPKYNSIYVQAINGIGEFDGGQRSGWMYNINGIYPNRGASAIKVKDGDTIQWRYTMDYGNDIGGYLGDY